MTDLERHCVDRGWKVAGSWNPNQLAQESSNATDHGLCDPTRLDCCDRNIGFRCGHAGIGARPECNLEGGSYNPSGRPIGNLISIFSVDNLNQRALLKALQDGTETFFSQMPGFVSSTVLVSKDGKRVINYSQWRTVDDIAAFRRDSRFLPYLQQLRALASIESGEFDAVHSQGV
jgi:heme-degrading monooxygenase HmoA